MSIFLPADEIQQEAGSSEYEGYVHIDWMNEPVNEMKSITTEKLRIDHEPVAILWSNTKPEGALQIKPHGVKYHAGLCTSCIERKNRRV